MKKIVLFVLLSLGVSSTYAQISFGILAGGRAASQRWGSDSFGEKKKFFPQWHAGIAVDIPLAGKFYLQPQLLASVKGSHTEATGLDSSTSFVLEASSKERLMYIELPVNVLFKQPLGRGKLIAGAGPYIAYGLGGKLRGTGRYRDGRDFSVTRNVRFENKSRFSNEDMYKNEYFKPLDAGLNFIAGYELNNGLCFHVNYSLGLTNIAPSGGMMEDGVTHVSWTATKNSYLALSVGYVLRRHK